MARRRKARKMRDGPAIAEPGASSGTMPGAPPAAVPEENLEADVAPAIVERRAADREESPETDAAPSVIDDEPPATPPDPESCSEPKEQGVPSDDLS